MKLLEMYDSVINKHEVDHVSGIGVASVILSFFSMFALGAVLAKTFIVWEIDYVTLRTIIVFSLLVLLPKILPDHIMLEKD